MKTYGLFVLFLLIVASSTVSRAQKFPYEEYEPRTLDELVTQSAASVISLPNKPKLMLDAKPFYSAIRVKYVGTARPISPEKKNLFKMWQESMSADPKMLTLLENEYLFQECGKDYWVPVQKPVAAYFSKELKSGDTITLYLMVIGGLKLSDKEPFDPAFLVNEFRKY